MKYKLKEDFILDKIEGKITLFNVTNSTFYTFNDVGSYLVEKLFKGIKKGDLVVLLIKKYGITKARAVKDINVFLKELSNNKIISSLK